MSAKPSLLTPVESKPEQAKPKSLVSKLAEVMAAVSSIPKRGENTFHHYKYATEADIVAAIRMELASRHIILVPAVTKWTREAVGEKGSVLTHLDMEFTLIDGESGETLARPWLGAGTDKEDKGAYKAMTGGEKYFLLKTFLIPTGDDPEGDKPQDRGRQQRKGPRDKAAPPPEDAAFITKEQCKTLIDAAVAEGWTKDEVRVYLNDNYGGWEKVPVSEYETLMGKFTAGDTQPDHFGD